MWEVAVSQEQNSAVPMRSSYAGRAQNLAIGADISLAGDLYCWRVTNVGMVQRNEPKDALNFPAISGRDRRSPPGISNLRLLARMGRSRPY